MIKWLKNVRSSRKLHRLVRMKFGMWTLGITTETGHWVLSNHWKGHVYIEKEGRSKAGEPIFVPKGTKVLYL